MFHHLGDVPNVEREAVEIPRLLASPGDRTTAAEGGRTTADDDECSPFNINLPLIRDSDSDDGRALPAKKNKNITAPDKVGTKFVVPPVLTKW